MGQGRTTYILQRNYISQILHLMHHNSIAQVLCLEDHLYEVKGIRILKMKVDSEM